MISFLTLPFSWLENTPSIGIFLCIVFPQRKQLFILNQVSEKADLKLNIQKTKIMASGPITSWQIDGETMEAVTNFSWAAKITADMKLKD